MSDALSDSGDGKLNARILQWDYAQSLRDPSRLFQLDFFHPARYVLAFSENLFGDLPVRISRARLGWLGRPQLQRAAPVRHVPFRARGLGARATRHRRSDRGGRGGDGVRVPPVEDRPDPPPSAPVGGVPLPGPAQPAPLPRAGPASRSRPLRRRVRLERARERALRALLRISRRGDARLVRPATDARSGARASGGRSSRRSSGPCPFLPFAAGYRHAEKLYGFRRYLSEIETYSGRWTDFLAAGRRNHLWGRVTERWVAAEGVFFPGALPVLLAVLAVVILWKRRSSDPQTIAPHTAGRGRILALRAADVVIAGLALVGLTAALAPGLRLGPVRVGDPGRVLVILTVAVAVRLFVGVPGRGQRTLGGLLRGTGLEPRAALMLSLALCGLVVALGSHTPFYRFLPQTFGAIFRAIRAPSRGHRPLPHRAFRPRRLGPLASDAPPAGRPPCRRRGGGARPARPRVPGVSPPAFADAGGARARLRVAARGLVFGRGRRVAPRDPVRLRVRSPPGLARETARQRLLRILPAGLRRARRARPPAPDPRRRLGPGERSRRRPHGAAHGFSRQPAGAPRVRPVRPEGHRLGTHRGGRHHPARRRNGCDPPSGGGVSRGPASAGVAAAGAQRDQRRRRAHRAAVRRDHISGAPLARAVARRLGPRRLRDRRGPHRVGARLRGIGPPPHANGPASSSTYPSTRRRRTTAAGSASPSPICRPERTCSRSPSSPTTAAGRF